MVFWASPNEDSENQSARRGDALSIIGDLQADKKLMEGLENLEKSLGVCSASLACIDGAIYKVPSIKVVATSEDAKKGVTPPAAKRRKTSKSLSAVASSSKGKGGEFKDPGDEPALASLETYPPTDAMLGKLKKAATVRADVNTETGADSAEASTSKKKDIVAAADFIDEERIYFWNQEEWFEKGVKTPILKIAKTLVPDDIDPQSISLKLHGMQLVGEQGLDWNEAPGGDHIGTFLVVLPFKYKGGKISIRHAEDSWSIDPAKSKSTVRCSWIAFSSEAQYRVDGVEGVKGGGGGVQAILVYSILGLRKAVKRGKKAAAASSDKPEVAIVAGIDKLAKELKPDAHFSRFGIFLANKYNPKSFSASALKGQDRWLYNLLNESKYEVKLTFVRVLMTAWGFFDSRDWHQPEKKVQMTECGEEWLESEIWEMDMSKAEKWRPAKWKDDDGKEHDPMTEDDPKTATDVDAKTPAQDVLKTTKEDPKTTKDDPKSATPVDANTLFDWMCRPGEHHKCRRLPWEMPWLHKNLFASLPLMTRVDREPLPSWSEGLWLSETYRVAALLVTVKPDFKDEEDGPYTHFYPVAHPEPRGVSEREDMSWSKPAMMYILPGDTQEELDEMDRKYWARRNWVHQDLD